MAFLQIKSDNKNMSYVLGKNPASRMQVRKIRQGTAFGWYTPGNEQEFNVWFKDSETEVSYKSHPNEQFEHVNKTRYNSAVAILNMISEFFSQTTKKDSEYDKEGCNNRITINMLDISSDRILEMVDYVDGFEVSTEELANKNFRVTISTNKSMKILLNFVNVFCLYAAMKNNRDFVDLNSDTIEKYLTSLSLVDPPYFVRYVFKINVLRSRGKFEKHKETLEETSHHDQIKLTYGDSHYARRDWLKSQLGELNNSIVDVGCGEGFYVFDLAKKLPEDKVYHAVDVDPEIRDIIEKKAAKRDLVDKIKVHDLVHNFEHLKGKDVLFIEVLEHMPYEDAVNMGKLLTGKKADRIFITTPNVSFNDYYFLKDELRHEDHHFELNQGEFQEYLEEIDIDNDYEVKLCQIGDVVDNRSTTLGAVLTRKDLVKVQTGEE